MGYINKFETIGEFNTYFTDIPMKYPYLSYVAENNTVYYTTPPPIKIVCYDSFKNKMVKVKYNKLEYNENIKPIGIEIIPITHNVYGNGKCGVMSLKEMSIATPTEGGLINDAILWGTTTDTSGKNFNKVITVSNGTLSSGNFGYLGVNGVYAGTPTIPHPYNEDYSRNEDYSNTSVSTYNAMSDFKGKENTKTILYLRGNKDYTSWNPSNVINDYPAASVCDMYYTEGTTQGEWYLPSMGEIGYIPYCWDQIQEALNLVNEKYPSLATPLTLGGAYWSSTENAAKNARYLHTQYGAGYSDKNTKYAVRAFTQI